MGDSLSYLDLLLPRDITPKKETLGRKKHNREDRTEVIIVSDDETESVVKRGQVRRDHYRINNSRYIYVLMF